MTPRPRLSCPRGAVCLHSCRLRPTARVVLRHTRTELFRRGPVTLSAFPQEHLIENEVSILRRVDCQNIISTDWEMETATELFLVMELVKGRGGEIPGGPLVLDPEA